MARLFKARHMAMGVALAAGALVATSASADAQGRMRVLVPTFDNAQGSTTREGQRLAEQVRRAIDEMPRHAPLEDKAWKAALKKYDLREQDMSCIEWKQLAQMETTMGAGLVMCGTYDESTGTVSGEFSPAGGGDGFKIPAFQFQDRDQAASHIVQAFNTYTRQLTVLTSCDEYIRGESWEQALQSCTEAVELNPQSTSGNYLRGSALLKLKRPEEARPAFEAVLAVDPINSEALLAAGYTAAQLKQQEVSQRYLREYLAMNPGDIDVRLSIATELANQGDPSGALKLTEEVATGADATAQIFTYAGHFAMNAGLAAQQDGSAPTTDAAAAGGEAMALFRKAVQHYERALEMTPADSVDGAIYRNLMLAHRNIGNMDRALAIGQRATADGDNAQALSIYADVLKDAGRIDEAIAALDRAVQIDPEMQNLGARKGLMLLDANRLNEAVAAFKQANGAGLLSPDLRENVAQRLAVNGFNLTQQQRYNDAMPYFRASRELGTSERSVGMVNFFHGYTLVMQADGILRTATTAGPARTARPLLDEARRLLQNANGYTEQRAKTQELLGNVAQYIEVADALIRAGNE
ncbi:hypothetical protein BH23GEM10_BH23GEM10_05480 [soil metagenome]